MLAFLLTLALFKAWVFLVDNVDAALPTDNLTVRGAAFNGGANFHILYSKKVNYTLNGKTKTPSRDKAQE